jgi:hypothetical protein
MCARLLLTRNYLHTSWATSQISGLELVYCAERRLVLAWWGIWLKKISYILGPLGIVVKIEFKVNGEETGDGHCVTVGFIQVGLPPRLTIFNTKCQHSCINLHHRRKDWPATEHHNEMLRSSEPLTKRSNKNSPSQGRTRRDVPGKSVQINKINLKQTLWRCGCIIKNLEYTTCHKFPSFVTLLMRDRSVLVFFRWTMQ